MALLCNISLQPNAYVLPQGVLQSDADLTAHVGHLKYRWSKFVDLKKSIEAAEGSLANFALVRPLRHPEHAHLNPSVRPFISCLLMHLPGFHRAAHSFLNLSVRP